VFGTKYGLIVEGISVPPLIRVVEYREAELRFPRSEKVAIGLAARLDTVPFAEPRQKWRISPSIDMTRDDTAANRRAP
jgi:hypothetical protein